MDNNYEDLEINPDFFVKCRLCVDENGCFQIHPQIQEKIKFCFDITVQYLDNLPQLICKKCKNTLFEYATIKTKFIENQALLLQKLQESSVKLAQSDPESWKEDNKKPLDNDDIPVKPQTPEILETTQEESRTPIKLILKKKKRKRIITSSSESETEAPKELRWESCYDKRYGCRYCDTKLSSKHDLIQHWRSHKSLIKIANKYIKKHCTVSLERINKQPNLTGSNKFIVLKPNNILDEEGNIEYSISYVSRENKNSDSNIITKSSDTKNESSTDSKPRKKRCKDSKGNKELRSSSNETVVLDNKDEPAQPAVLPSTQEVHCIDIDDSSSDSNKTSSVKSKTEERNEEGNHKLINDIIISRQKSFIKSNEADLFKNDKRNNVLEEMLNKKFLSVGRKVVCSNGINFSGIVKYLEHKNVDIEWIPSFKANNPVRIMTQMTTNTNDKNIQDWDIAIKAVFRKNLVLSNTKKTHDENNSNTVKINKIITAEDKTKNDTKDLTNKSVTQASGNKNDTTELCSGKSISEDKTGYQLYTENKILNANPVANPKQLPKKNATVDPKSKLETDKETISIDSDDDLTNSQLPLPIITSTKSLAPETKEEENVANSETKTNTNSNGNEIVIPRIKCKPVSELMASNAPNALQLVNVQNNVLQESSIVTKEQNIKTLSFPSVPFIVQNLPLQSNNIPVVMHSIDLPHTKTIHPIEYFKNLLLMHGVTLITDLNHEVTAIYKCLIKFRMNCSQLNMSIIFAISLYAHNNVFCMKIRNEVVEEDTDITKLASPMQIKILKAFHGGVAEKMIEAANSVSPEVLSNTKKFTQLLVGMQSWNVS